MTTTLITPGASEALTSPGHTSTTYELTDDVPRVLGRPPREFVDDAREAAATGVWAAGDGMRSTR